MTELRLNIGCSESQRHGNGWINIDNRPEVKPDLLRDVCRGLPFDDESVSEVYARNFLEHLEPEDCIFFIQEVRRVLKKGCRAQFIVPLGVVPDLSHKQYFHHYSLENLISQPQYGVRDLLVISKDYKDYEAPWDYTELDIILERC